MKVNPKTTVFVSLIAAIAAICAVVIISGEEETSSHSAASAEEFGNSAKTGLNRSKIRNGRVRSDLIAETDSSRLHAEAVDDEYESLSPEMKKIYDGMQLALDNEDRKALSRLCDELSKIRQSRGENAIPAFVRAKAVEAIGLFLPETLAELVEYMSDSDPEVAESVFDQLDNFLNDTTLGDKELSKILVLMSKVLTNEDAVDSLATTIDMNMRNSVKVDTCINILDSGNEVAVDRIKETIADIIEVEVEDLSKSTDGIKAKLKEWLAENPDDEDDAEFYQGVAD